MEGLQRFPISVRYPRELRDSVSDLEQLPILTEDGAQITLGTVADLRITSGPPMLRSENARLGGLDDLEATLPETRPLVFFLTVTDSEGAVTSSEHVELPAK